MTRPPKQRKPGRFAIQPGYIRKGGINEAPTKPKPPAPVGMNPDTRVNPPQRKPKQAGEVASKGGFWVQRIYGVYAPDVEGIDYHTELKTAVNQMNREADKASASYPAPKKGKK